MPSPALTLRDVTGSDASLPRWLRREDPPVRPRFDSVVVRGSGIVALVLAARLARSNAFADRVVVAGPPVQENRRLLGGVTLRARALDYYAAAFGATRDALLQLLYEGEAERARTLSQVGSCCERDGAGRMEIVRAARWMDHTECGGRPLAFGIRNSHLAARLEQLAHKLPIRFHPEPVDGEDAMRALAPGSRPLLVNAAPGPLAREGAPPLAPHAFVAACQVPFANHARADRGILPDGAGFFGCTLRSGRNDVAIFNPLVDPLSPRAEYYGIQFRILAADVPFDRDAELGLLEGELYDIGAAMGLDPVDPEETQGRAVVPCVRVRDLRGGPDDHLPLHGVVHAGHPIITGDGMAKAGLAGTVAAEAVLAGRDPLVASIASLRRWRALNTGLALGMTRFARLAARAIRTRPGPVLAGAAQPDFWAGVA